MNYPSYQPKQEDIEAANKVLSDFVKAQSVIKKNYNQFNGRQLYDVIDDWTKRWNGFIPSASPLLDNDQSRIFLNFTRNQIISYLSKVALQRPIIKVKAVNKKLGSQDYRFSEVLEDLNMYSLNEENGDARFLETAMEATTKGTVIVYEGYKKTTQEVKVPVKFDAETGKGKFKKEERIIFDNCFQKIVPVEDFYIPNPYEPDVQKQPFVIWREITTYNEAKREFGDYENWKYVTPGKYQATSESTTFYRQKLEAELTEGQVEILRYYTKCGDYGTTHTVLINGVVIYDGPIPFKDGNYPFAKGVFEPYDNSFFWGASFAQKIMGDQDLLNTLWNMMVDKTYGSLLPYGLSSDIDDFVEDEILQPNKIRKVSDINKWKFDSLPGVNAGEQNMLQQAITFARDNSGNVTGAGQQFSPKGGKLNVRQILLQQQETMAKLGFSITFLENLERDRTLLRINHILQFYSIPKIEKITGADGKEMEQLVYRDVRLSEVPLSNGRQGDKVIRMMSSPENEDERQRLANDMSVEEMMGEMKGTNVEILAVNVDTFYDYNFSVQVVRNSSYEKNQALDQAARLEYANWRLSVAQFAPLDVEALVNWVSESFDIDESQFKAQGQQMQQMQQQMMMQGQAPMGGQPNKLQQVQPTKNKLSEIL